MRSPHDITGDVAQKKASKAEDNVNPEDYT
jgi:hypothetical protein